MIFPSPIGINEPTQSLIAEPQSNIQESPDKDAGARFEKLLWSQMLQHTGLEDAFTKNGGQAVSAFSQFMLEALAEDLAEKHPLGLSSAILGQSDEATPSNMQPPSNPVNDND